MYEITRRVKYYETDNMGVVHHSNYIRWFEEVRVECLRDKGLDYRAMEEEGIMIPVVSVECRYKTPAAFDDEVAVCASFKRYNGIVMEIEYVVKDLPTGIIRVTGKSSHCFVDSKTFKPLSLAKVRPDMNERFAALVEK